MFAVGGAERILFDVINNLDKNIFEPKLVCLKGGEEKFSLWKNELESQGIEIIIIDPVVKMGRLKRLIKTMEYLKNEKPDIVHTQLFSADVVGRIAAKLAGRKIIISTEHNLNLADGIIKRIFKALTSRLSFKIIAVSEAVKEYAIAREGADPKKTDVIYNGIETEKFRFDGRDYNKKNIIIGAMGRLTFQKGFDFFIKSIARLNEPGLECLIAGGEDVRENGRESLENLIRDMDLEEKIKLAGLQKNPLDFYKKIDIFVLSSRWEGFPIVLLEAGMAGLPVVAAEVGGIGEVIKDGHNGILVKSGDIEGLSEKLKYLIDHPEERDRTGNNLKKTILEKFNISKTVRKYESVYIEAVNARKIYEKNIFIHKI